MAKEIERKFLVKNETWRTDERGQARQGESYRQGYLKRDPACVVRVRLEGDRAFITLKGKNQALGTALSRSEFQYEIPADDCREILRELADKPIIEKTRYKIHSQDFIWEVDEFHGENQGLIVAEIELESHDQSFPRPDWLGEEVSQDKRYSNAALVTHPYCRW